MYSELQDISEFLQLLQQRERIIIPPDTDSGRNSYAYFANALLRNAIQRNRSGLCRFQLGVIGPTQSGKSSVVNLLLGTKMAAAKPAGRSYPVCAWFRQRGDDTGCEPLPQVGSAGMAAG